MKVHAFIFKIIFYSAGDLYPIVKEVAIFLYLKRHSLGEKLRPFTNLFYMLMILALFMCVMIYGGSH